MRDILKGISGKEEEGGDSFASLLFVVAAFVFAATTFALTDALMGNRDTTMSFVPMSATAYVHSNGYASTETLLSSSAEMPAGIHPYEFALFSAPGDDMPQHGSILAWGRLKKPTAAEIDILKERGAVRLDDRHYFFGDASLATAAKVARAAHASLSHDAVRSKALAAMRALFSVQIMTNPREAVGSLGSPILDTVLTEITPETAVVGVSIRGRSFIARMTSLSVPLADSIDRGVTAKLHPARIKADVIITEAMPSFALSNLFSFDHPGETGVTDDALAESDEVLHTALASPFALWIRKATETRPSPLFLFHFPLITTENAADAVSQSFAIRNPTSQNLALPDGDTASELFIRALPGPWVSTSGDLTFGNEVSKVIVGSDGASGSLIGSDASMIVEYRRQKTTNNQSTDPCGRYANKLIINDITFLSGGNALFSFLADKTGINTLSFNRAVGNETLFCGYIK